MLMREWMDHAQSADRVAALKPPPNLFRHGDSGKRRARAIPISVASKAPWYQRMEPLPSGRTRLRCIGRLGGDQMRDLGLAVEMEAIDRLLEHAIGMGDPFVLAQMLQP